MVYRSLYDCLTHLERHQQLIRIHEEVDPFLEMAAIHLRVHEAGGPALLFENIKGCKYKAASNIFGTLERSKLIFGNKIRTIQQLIELKNNPVKALKNPIKNISTAFAALKSLPKKISSAPVMYEEVFISDLPQIVHWPNDGGAFVTLPQVYTEDIDQPGIMQSNLGMYRIQLSGNDYLMNKEIGLHYQLHRGIGVHQTKANEKNQPLKVSIFVGGAPAHTVAAVMPLPEGMSELSFAGALGGRRFRYKYVDGFCISADADFVITGYVYPNENKPEGPFGDHLGYYSLQHLFPVMQVHKVYARKNAIWPFTVVGRPPQEDTSFGKLIHELTGQAVQNEIPGLKEIHAVDAAGVHPLLLAIGSERYTPYQKNIQPAELLTIANHILGTGQLSLAKFLFITADDSNQLHANTIQSFFEFILKRIQLQRDIHFYTNTTIDTLDYSGTGLNSGSKVVFAAYGNEIRQLGIKLPEILKNNKLIKNVQLIMPGVAAIETSAFKNYESAIEEMKNISASLESNLQELNNFPLLILCDDADFTSKSLNNFLWVSFTRTNPANDIYGVKSFVLNKHWGCEGSCILDARAKPHHAPILEKDTNVEKRINRLFNKGGSLYGAIQ